MVYLTNLLYKTQITQSNVKSAGKQLEPPEKDRFSLSDGDIVHHFIVGLRIPLATDRQPCRHKKQNPQRENNCAFGKSDQVSPERHRP